jgi:molybdopterin synthase catalytic subunit
MEMQVTVRLFGSIREAAGAKELAVVVPEGSTVDDLRVLLARDHPSFEEMADRLRVSVNYEISRGDSALSEGDEVAFLPPVSGGSGSRTLSTEPLDVGSVVNRVIGPDIGGIVSFIGTVRDTSRGHSIRHLEYEAYPEMAEREIQKIAHDAEERWPGTRVAVAHRRGRLEVGEIAVVVAAGAPHRGDAFAAARYTIDTLKVQVPIWKKEVTTDGEYWVEDHA